MSREKIEIRFDVYYKYDELIGVVRTLVEEYPKLAELKCIGESYEGRKIWLVEITNKSTGPALEKPAFWMDGNIHAGEVTASIANLKFIWHLLTKYGADPYITELLDERVIYVVPRTNPDGAELYLTSPYTLRSSVRPFPYSPEEWEEQEGLYQEDVDGDGWITQMRVTDPDGDWRVSNEDPRLMVKRTTEDDGGSFYKIYTEGMILNWDGGEIKMAPHRWGMDMNRCWPANFTPSNFLQKGITLYPGSEPEIRAHLEFVREHRNVSLVVVGHTSGGMILREFSTFPDSHFIWRDEVGGHRLSTEWDLAFYKYLEEKSEEMCGYPMYSTYDGYKGKNPRSLKHPSRGSQKQWWYEHTGVISMTIEYWDVAEHVGLGTLIEREGERIRDWSNEEHGLKLLEWNDRELNGWGFVPWTPFKHPQLGFIEIGGWKSKFMFQNPPPKYLEAEITKVNKFILWLASQTPLIKITKTGVEKLGDGLYKVKALIENKGFLPSYGSHWAKSLTVDSPVVAKIQVEGEAELVGGKKRVVIGDIEGKSYKILTPRATEEKTSKQVAWTVRSMNPEKAKVSVISISQKGGTDRIEIKLA